MPLRVLLFFVIFLTGFPLCSVHRAFVRRLREHHESAWNQLGAPQGPFDVSGQTVFRYAHLVLARKYRAFNDQRLHSLGDWAFVLLLVTLFAAIAMVLVPENSYIPLP